MFLDLGEMEVVWTLVQDNFGFSGILGGRSKEGVIVMERLSLVEEMDKEENDLDLMKVNILFMLLSFLEGLLFL